MHRASRYPWPLALVVLLAACGGIPPVAPDTLVVGGARPATVFLPPDHDRTAPTPLLMVLHGYASDAERIEERFPLAAAAAVAGVMVVYPQGTTDVVGRRFWNAAEACCDLFGVGVDDEAYLLDLLAAIAADVAVERVVLFGHSNGGFMAYRLACRHPERFAAVVSVSGALDDPPPDCGDAGPSRVLQIHGTDDRVIVYDGGNVPSQPPYTSAPTTAGVFATGAGCGAFEAGTAFDLDIDVDGAETVPLEAACPAGRRVALWRMDGGGHEPTVRADFAARILRFTLGLQ